MILPLKFALLEYLSFECNVCLFTLYRGSSFRRDFLTIVEARSVLPIMALTATATLSMRKMIISALDMANCHVIAKVPSQVNITYEVESGKDIQSFTAPLIEELRQKGINADKSIVFCRSYKDLLSVFQEFVVQLHGTLIIREEGKRVGRLVEKYDACTEPALKTEIVEQFAPQNGITRVVVATSAFGMGIDSPNVRHIIHWGPTTSLMMYVQEVGRCGRDGKQSKATLFLKPHIGQHIDENMRSYCQQKETCRRQLLMSPFMESSSAYTKPSVMHLCCDVCAGSCQCLVCDGQQLFPCSASSLVCLQSPISYRQKLALADVQLLRLKIINYR